MTRVTTALRLRAAAGRHVCGEFHPGSIHNKRGLLLRSASDWTLQVRSMSVTRICTISIIYSPSTSPCVVGWLSEGHLPASLEVCSKPIYLWTTFRAVQGWVSNRHLHRLCVGVGVWTAAFRDEDEILAYRCMCKCACLLL